MKTKERDVKQAIIELAKHVPFAVNIKGLLDKITELERLAEIGRAAEKALQHGYFIYDIVETWEGKLLTYNKDETIEELLKWSTK